MKIILSIILLFSSLFSPEMGNKKGVNFFQGDFQEAEELAKKENKLLFVFVSANWCQPCKKMKEQVFPDSTLGDLYNHDFVNLLVENEKKTKNMLIKKYGVTVYPTLLFLDHEGKLIKSLVGSRNSHDMLRIGQEVKRFAETSFK